MVKVSEYLEAEGEPFRKELHKMLAEYPAGDQVHPITLSMGESLTHEDDPNNMIYCLMKGHMSVTTNQTDVSRYTLTEAAAPGFFREYEVLDGIPRYIAEVRAVTPYELAAFPVDTYLLWMRCD